MKRSIKKTAVKKTAAKKNANTMWGGRFETGPDALMARINASIDFDKRLYAQDIRASIAHARMLGTQHIIAAKDVAAIVGGLQKILQQIERGAFEFKTELEDIHLNVEKRLTDMIGPAGGRRLGLGDRVASLTGLPPDRAPAGAALLAPQQLEGAGP